MQMNKLVGLMVLFVFLNCSSSQDKNSVSSGAEGANPSSSAVSSQNETYDPATLKNVKDISYTEGNSDCKFTGQTAQDKFIKGKIVCKFKVVRPLYGIFDACISAHVGYGNSVVLPEEFPTDSNMAADFGGSGMCIKTFEGTFFNNLPAKGKAVLTWDEINTYSFSGDVEFQNLLESNAAIIPMKGLYKDPFFRYEGTYEQGYAHGKGAVAYTNPKDKRDTRTITGEWASGRLHNGVYSKKKSSTCVKYTDGVPGEPGKCTR